MRFVKKVASVFSRFANRHAWIPALTGLAALLAATGAASLHSPSTRRANGCCCDYG